MIAKLIISQSQASHGRQAQGEDVAENSSCNAWGGLHTVAGVSLLGSLGCGAKAANLKLQVRDSDVKLCLLRVRSSILNLFGPIYYY